MISIKGIINPPFNMTVDQVELLMQLGVDFSVNDNLAIKMTAENGDADIVKMLLRDPRVDASAGHNHALINAKLNGFDDVVRLLLQDHNVINMIELMNLNIDDYM